MIEIELQKFADVMVKMIAKDFGPVNFRMAKYIYLNSLSFFRQQTVFLKNR